MAGTSISARLSNKIKENVAQKDTINLRDNKILEHEDKIHALQTQLSIEEAKVKKWESMQEKGYTAVTINNGMITNAVTVLPYSIFTYTQKIPDYIDTTLYSKFPFYKLLDGKMVIDTQKYMRYKSI